MLVGRLAAKKSRARAEQLYQAFYAIRHKAAEFNALTPAQQKIIDNALRDFHLSGFDLPVDKKQRFKEIQVFGREEGATNR